MCRNQILSPQCTAHPFNAAAPSSSPPQILNKRRKHHPFDVLYLDKNLDWISKCDKNKIKTCWLVVTRKYRRAVHYSLPNSIEIRKLMSSLICWKQRSAMMVSTTFNTVDAVQWAINVHIIHIGNWCDWLMVGPYSNRFRHRNQSAEYTSVVLQFTIYSDKNIDYFVW